MAIEGGCAWIQVTDSTDNGMSVKETIEEIRPLCEENGTFLIIDNNVELTKEMRVHGVYLRKNSMSPSVAREMLGPHAVIGIEVESVEDIFALKNIDIDYVVINLTKNNESAIEKCLGIIKQAKNAIADLPVVVRGEVSVVDITPLKKAGANGIAIWEPITEAADPVGKTKEIISMLNNG